MRKISKKQILTISMILLSGFIMGISPFYSSTLAKSQHPLLYMMIIFAIITIIAYSYISFITKPKETKKQ